jgi:hypothetical protein
MKLSEVKMIKKVNKEKLIIAIVEEFLALINDKYQIKYSNPIFETKTSWEIHKPIFYFDIYPESKVDDTLWVMDFFYFKIRRRR